jgi:anti-sigma B factor antagonist
MMPDERTAAGAADEGAAVGTAGGTAGEVAVVTPPAEIDIVHAASFRAALARAAAAHPTVVVDLTQTVFCDSTGLRLLLQAADRAARDGGELRLVLAGPQLLRIFAVTGFDQLFPIFATLAQALAGRGRDAGQ